MIAQRIEALIVARRDAHHAGLVACQLGIAILCCGDGGQPRRLAAGVDLVADQRQAGRVRQARDEFRPDLHRVRRRGGRGIDQQQDAVRLLDLVPGALHADALDGVRRVAQPGGIDDMQWHAVEMDVLTQHVAGGAFDIGDDGGVLLGQRIEQARLAGIRAAGDHHRHPLAHQSALVGSGSHAHQLGLDLIEARRDMAVGQEVDFLFGEVDGGLDVDAQLDQALHQRADARRELALERAQRIFGRRA